MRRAFFALLLAGALLAAPALAAAPKLPLHQEIGRDFVTGAVFYYKTVHGWIDSVLSLVGLIKEKRLIGEGADCSGDAVCSPGLVCLNACDNPDDCQRYSKRCGRGPDHVTVLGEFSPCSDQNLCTAGTDCTLVCQKGLDCGTDAYRCMKPIVPTGSCQADTDCVATCGGQAFPPMGPSAFEAHCVQNACWCYPLAIKPNASRVACPPGDGAELSCPTGTQVACVTGTNCGGGACPTVKTCLTSPTYGGECLGDQDCAGADCVAGAQAFCGDDRRCKCRVTQSETVTCTKAADCASAGCASNEIPACVQGNCACAPAGNSNACKTASDCTPCTDGYTTACEKNACVCQKTTFVPIACKTVADCGSVTCPADYDKLCKDAACACASKVK